MGINKIITKELQIREIEFAMIAFIMVFLPFAISKIIKYYLPETHELILRTVLIEYNTLLFIILIFVLFIMIWYVQNYKENYEVINIQEKKNVIDDILKYSNNLHKYKADLGISDEMISIFNHKIQILNKQINSEEYRNYRLNDDFFMKMKNINRKIEDILLKVI